MSAQVVMPPVPALPHHSPAGGAASIFDEETRGQACACSRLALRTQLPLLYCLYSFVTETFVPFNVLI